MKDWKKIITEAIEKCSKWLFRFRTLKAFSIFVFAETACVGYYSFWIQGHIEKEGQQSINWTISSGEATLYGCIIGFFILTGFAIAINYQNKCDNRKHESEMQGKVSDQHQGDPYKGEKWLKELLSYFSFYLMDTYFKDMPSCFRYDLLTTMDAWHGCLTSSAFQMNDKQLLNLISEFYKSWRNIETFGQKYYCTDAQIQYCKFEPLKGDLIIDPIAEHDFYKIAKDVNDLYPKYIAFVNYLKSNYPDIDLDEISHEFQASLLKI